jgi:hypothetical protein
MGEYQCAFIEDDLHHAPRTRANPHRSPERAMIAQDFSLEPKDERGRAAPVTDAG